MTNALTVVDGQQEVLSISRHIGDRIPSDLAEVNQFAQLFITSGVFTDVKQVAAASVKILRGAELGITPFAAMQGLHIIQGQVTMSANLMATLIQRSRKYDYRVKILTDDECTIEYFVNLPSGERQSLGESGWTRKDATRAGTKNIEKFPRNMNFARAMANGFRFYTPELSCGMPAYVPEEFGAEVDTFGRVVETVLPAGTPPPAEQKPAEEVTPFGIEQFCQTAADFGFLYDGKDEYAHLAKILIGRDVESLSDFYEAYCMEDGDWQAAVQKANQEIAEVKPPKDTTTEAIAK